MFQVDIHTHVLVLLYKVGIHNSCPKSQDIMACHAIISRSSSKKNTHFLYRIMFLLLYPEPHICFPAIQNLCLPGHENTQQMGNTSSANSPELPQYTPLLHLEHRSSLLPFYRRSMP